MIAIPKDIVGFLDKQGFVIVSTLDGKGGIHCSAKGILLVEPQGSIQLIDLYRGRTLANLKNDPRLSITCVDEHRFIGYTLKGNALLSEDDSAKGEILQRWYARISGRISKRLIRSIKEGRSSFAHPEASMPEPVCLITMRVDEIIDLAPLKFKAIRPR
jgi:hypothetical protein